VRLSRGRWQQNDPMRETSIRIVALLVGLVMFGVGIGSLFLADLGVGTRMTR